jgi:hypothetical protein
VGETASTWKTPLHSSDSEHEDMKRYNSKGKGGAFRLNRGERSFPRRISDLEGPGTNASSVLTNPFDEHSD